MSPSLKDFRAWLRGETDTPYGEPIRPRKGSSKVKLAPAQEDELEPMGGLDPERMEKDRASTDRRFKVSVDGTDAMLCFGKHSGKTIKDLKISKEGRGYLRWMLKEAGFPEGIKEIIGLYIDEPSWKPVKREGT